jgi:chloramphenicol-sensitive protein RarD
MRGGGPTHALLLASTGIVTAIPLLCFGAAANRIPLVLIGVLQYVSPTLQFVCGVVIQREAMPSSRWAGFGLVWAGLVILAVDGVIALRRTVPVSTAGIADGN